MSRSVAIAGNDAVRLVKAVLDTNLIVFAQPKGKGREALMLELALAGRFKLVVSKALLEEYEGLLRRPPFNLDLGKVAQSIRAIRNMALLVQPQKQSFTSLAIPTRTGFSNVLWRAGHNTSSPAMYGTSRSILSISGSFLHVSSLKSSPLIWSNIPRVTDGLLRGMSLFVSVRPQRPDKRRRVAGPSSAWNPPSATGT